jgi:hypothetical protein
MIRSSILQNFTYHSWQSRNFQTIKVEAKDDYSFESTSRQSSNFFSNEKEKKQLRGDILICSLYAGGLSGTEQYVYSLAKELDQQGYDVTIASDHTKDIKKLHNVKYISISDLSGDSCFNIIHLNQYTVAQSVCEILPHTPKVYTIHSEVVPGELPYLHSSIKKYIATRPKIVDLLNQQLKIPLEKIELIYNPIDDNIFNQKDVSQDNYVVFFETINNLSKEAIKVLVDMTRQERKQLILIGSNQGDFLDEILKKNTHVQHFEEDESLYITMLKKCSYSASLLVGRGALESWMCGKKCLIFDIDQNGRILNKSLIEKNKNEICDFQLKNVVSKIKNLYFDLKVLVKIPTKNRTIDFLKVFEKYYKFTSDHNNTHFLISLDTSDSDAVFVSNKMKEYPNVTVVVDESYSKVNAINRDINEFSKSFNWDIIIVGSDDMIPQKEGYDNIIRSKIKEINTTDAVLFFNDGFRQDTLNTIPIMGRKYYDRFDYVYSESYLCNYCDNEFTKISKKLNKSHYFEDVIFKHDHPFNSKGLKGEDFVHNNNKKYENIDFNTYQKRKQTLFFIPKLINCDYRKPFQYPGITEKQSFYNHSNIFGHHENKDSINIYFSFPWASFLDDLNNEYTSRDQFDYFFNKYIKKIQHYKELCVAYNKEIKIHTVCQHIEWFKLIEVWEQIGINHAHVSHLTNKFKNKNIKFYPWTLIACNVENEASNKQLSILEVDQKEFLFSFVGSYIESHRSDIRLRIKSLLSNLVEKNDFYFELTNKWFLEDIVYEEQLKSIFLNESFYEKQEKNIIKYNEVLSKSIFSLCPEGTGPNTLRLWESMSVGAIPVLFENDWIPPCVEGYDWEDLVIVVSQKDFEKFPDTLRSFSKEKIHQMRNNCINAYIKFRLLNCFDQKYTKLEEDKKEKIIDCDKIINLYTTYFCPKEEERKKELDYCITKNINNPYIKNIFLFLDDKTKESDLSDILEKNQPFSGKVSFIKIDKIPTYKDWIDNKTNDDSVSVFTNADIYFDETITKIPEYLKNAKSFVCVSRYEDLNEGAELHKTPHWSQDVWAIKSNDIIDDNFKRSLDIPTGKYRCDNKIAYVFTINGWDLYNPCKDIKCYHKHESNLRKYDELDTSIFGAIAFVHPTDNPDKPSDVDIEIMSLKTKNIKNYKVNSWLESEIDKRKSNLPTITVPLYGAEDKYFYRTKKCAFYDFVKSWKDRGYINTIESNESNYFWWGGKNNILLFDRDLIINLKDGKKDPPRWIGEIDYKFGFFGNQYNLINDKNFKFSGYFSYNPVGLEEFRKKIRKNFEEKKYESVFIGSIENETQEHFRQEFIEWGQEIDFYHISDKLNKNEKNKFQFDEYLEIISDSKFGVCFRGNGPKCYRDMEYLALGVPLIITEGVEVDYPDSLVEGIHYFKAKNKSEIKKIIKDVGPDHWQKMSAACWDWFEKNGSIDGIFNNLKNSIDSLNTKEKRHNIVFVNANRGDGLESVSCKSCLVFNPKAKIIFNDDDEDLNGDEIKLEKNDIIVNDLPTIDGKENYTWLIKEKDVFKYLENIKDCNLEKNKDLLKLFNLRFNNFKITIFDSKNQLVKNHTRLFNKSNGKCLYLNKDEKAIMNSDFDWSRRCSLKYKQVSKEFEGKCQIIFPEVFATLIYKKYNEIYNFDLSNHFNDFYCINEKIIPKEKVFEVCKLWEFENCDLKMIKGKIIINKEVTNFNYNLEND